MTWNSGPQTDGYGAVFDVDPDGLLARFLLERDLDEDPAWPPS